MHAHLDPRLETPCVFPKAGKKKTTCGWKKLEQILQDNLVLLRIFTMQNMSL